MNNMWPPSSMHRHLDSWYFKSLAKIVFVQHSAVLFMNFPFLTSLSISRVSLQKSLNLSKKSLFSSFLAKLRQKLVIKVTRRSLLLESLGSLSKHLGSTAFCSSKKLIRLKMLFISGFETALCIQSLRSNFQWTLIPDFKMYLCVSLFSANTLRQKIARIFMSRSSTIKPMSQRAHVTSIFSFLSLRQRIKLTKIFNISFSVSKSMSLVLKHEIIMVFKLSYSMMSFKFSSFSDNKLKHLQAN